MKKFKRRKGEKGTGDNVIIDAHAHACGDFLKPDNIVKILNENKADKVILVPGEFNSEKNYAMPNLAKHFQNKDVIGITNVLTKITIFLTGAAKQVNKGNEYVYSLTQKYPERIIQFYWVLLHSLKDENGLDTVLNQWNFRGIKLHQCWEFFKIRSEKFDMVAGWAKKNNLPIFIHFYSKKEVREFIHYIKSHPDITFIIGHLYGLESYIRSGLDFENVYFEISAPQLISLKRLQKAVDHFGAHKIVLGSDTPYGRNNLKLNIQRVHSLPISEEEKKLILGTNMQKLLNLE